MPAEEETKDVDMEDAAGGAGAEGGVDEVYAKRKTALSPRKASATMTSNETPYFPNEDDLDSLNVQFFELWSDKLKLCTVNTTVLDNLLPPDIKLVAQTNRRPDEDSQVPDDIENERNAALPPERPEALEEAGDDAYEIGETDCIDMTFLNDLRTEEYYSEKDLFFPEGRLLIRDCMREIFKLFVQADVRHGQVALIGSPGVGKSVLFFLVALYRARKETVVFLRKTAPSTSISAFIMRSRQHDCSVDVLFAREIPSAKKLADLWKYIWKDLMRLNSRRAVRCFVDGPKQHDDDGTLSGQYTFFCTSGGHDGFKEHQQGHKLWILDAWNDVDAVKALGLQACSREQAEKAYNLCGGNIRRMLKACSDQGFQDARTAIDIDINTAKNATKTIDALVFDGTNRSRLSLPDRLVTMFRSQASDSNFRMKAVQYVDSPYVLKQLAKNTGAEVFKRGYELAITLNDRTMQGLFYERYIHHWLIEKVKTEDGFCGITDVCWSEGSAKEGMMELKKPEMYWVPGTQYSELPKH